jgi:hypothetical protein
LIDTLLNLLFRCSHKRITRPITPAVNKSGVRDGETYVVCLECGKQFAYDLIEMRVGKPIASSSTSGVLNTGAPKANRKLRYAAIASVVPLAWFVGKSLKRSKNANTDSQP